MALVGLKANAAIYIVGDAPFGGWDPAAGVEMTPQGDGTYTYTTTISGTVYFVFADGLDSDWGIFNSSYRYGPAGGDQIITPGIWFATQKAGDNGAYRFPSSGEKYVITFDETNHQFKIDGYVEPLPTFTTYTVAGNNAAIFGSEWNETDVNNDMAKSENGLFIWTKENVALDSDFEFKIVGDHDWNNSWPVGFANNWVVSVPEPGNYTILISFEPFDHEITCTLTLTGDNTPVEHTYTVAGTENLFGTYWDPTDEANNMNKGKDGIYTWTKNSVEFAAEEIVEFKVVQDHTWDYAWPSSNWYYKSYLAGTYNVVITFDPSADDMNMITFTATRTGDLPDPPEPYEGNVYILGEVNNNGGWFTNKGFLMTRDATKNIYTATITTAGENDGYSYFSFTKKLAVTDAAWEEIDSYRFGPASDGTLFMTEDLLGKDINLATDGSYNAIAINAGTWNVTVDLVNNRFNIIKTNAPGPEPVYGDLNGDGAVNISDINLLINNILDDGENLDYDLNGDGSVNISDVALLIDCILSDHTPTTRTPSVTLERKGSELWCNITGEGNIYIDDENYGPAPVDHLVATQTDKAQTGSFIVYAIARGKEMSEIVDVDWELEAAEAPQQVTPTPSAELVRTGAELWCNITGEGDIYVDDVNFGPAPISFLITSQTERHQSGSYTVHAIAPDMEPSTPITVEWELEAKPVNGFGFADMLNTPDNTTVSFTRDAIVLWQRRYYLFAMDDTGFGLIYGDTGQTYNQGDVIPAGFGGNKMLYMGEPEIQNPTGFQPAVDNVNVSPLVISVDDIGHPLWSHYVVVKNVTIGDQEDSYGVRTITDADGATGAIYSGTFFVDLPEDLSKKYDIYGIINAYKSVYQILPTQFVPAE